MAVFCFASVFLEGRLIPVHRDHISTTTAEKHSGTDKTFAFRITGEDFAQVTFTQLAENDPRTPFTMSVSYDEVNVIVTQVSINGTVRSVNSQKNAGVCDSGSSLIARLPPTLVKLHPFPIILRWQLLSMGLVEWRRYFGAFFRNRPGEPYTRTL